MFVAVLGVIVERDVFSFLVKLELGRERETLGEGGFTSKLMRQLLRIHHGYGMDAGGIGESGIECQRTDACLATRSIGQLKKILLGLEFVVVKWNIGRSGGCRLQRSSRGTRARTAGRGRHQADGRVNGHRSCPEQKGQQ